MTNSRLIYFTSPAEECGDWDEMADVLRLNILWTSCGVYTPGFTGVETGFYFCTNDNEIMIDFLTNHAEFYTVKKSGNEIRIIGGNYWDPAHLIVDSDGVIDFSGVVISADGYLLAETMRTDGTIAVFDDMRENPNIFGLGANAGEGVLRGLKANRKIDTEIATTPENVITWLIDHVTEIQLFAVIADGFSVNW